MRLGFTLAAIYALSQDRPEHAVVWALLAIAWAITRGTVRKWLGWDDAMKREHAKITELVDDGTTLFDGRRD